MFIELLSDLNWPVQGYFMQKNVNPTQLIDCFGCRTATDVYYILVNQSAGYLFA